MQFYAYPEAARGNVFIKNYIALQSSLKYNLVHRERGNGL